MLRRVEQEADGLLRSLAVREPHDLHRLEDLAELLGIEVHVGGLRGSSARLVEHRGRHVLRVCEADYGTPRGRFSIAHELGHFRLHSHIDDAWCHAEDIASWGGRNPKEVEANAFASCFLLPSLLVEDRYQEGPPSLEVAEMVAREFQVSMLASAIRHVRLAAEPVALVVATAGVVSYVIRHDDFWPWIPSGEPLHPDSLAFDCHRSGRTVYSSPESVSATAWLGDKWDQSDLEIVESTIYRPYRRESVTMLWAREWPTQDEYAEMLEERGRWP